MSASSTTPARQSFTLQDMKRVAKLISREVGITHCQALERVAKQCGFGTYSAAKATLEEKQQ